MQLIILKDNLKTALIKTERAVTQNSNLPILKNVLLSADKNLVITSTNLELAIKTKAACKVVETGEITIPFHPLFSIVNNTQSERVTLQLDGEVLNIKTDNYEAKIQGLKADEFPIIPKIEEREKNIKIKTEILKTAISQVINAAQISELKPELSGILFDYQIGVLKLAATDSFRLAEKTLLNTDFESMFDEGFRVIIPLMTVNEVIKVFENNEEVTIAKDENQVLFESENSSVISRVISGEYPDYQGIIPKDFTTTLHIDRSELINAMRLVSSFSGKTTEVKLSLKEDANFLEIYSSTQSLGENNYKIPVKREGKDINEITFNWRYLLAGLQSISQEEIVFSLNSTQKPAMIKPQGDDSMFYIVMPLES